MFKSIIYLSLFFCLIACASSTEKTQVAEKPAQTQIDTTSTIASDTNSLNPIAITTENQAVNISKDEPTIATNEKVKPLESPKVAQTTSTNVAKNVETPPVKTPVAITNEPLKTQVSPPTNNPQKAENKPVLPPVPAKVQTIQNETPTKKAALSHKLWDELLKSYVTENGQVNYKSIIADKEKLAEYLEVLNQNPPQNDWDRNKQMAYWINTYNAFTIKLITEKYPIASINNVAAKPWDLTFISLGGKKYSLNQIENEILRPQFKEARIHFALNCAAKSCPKLLNEAFLPEKLDAQLEKQAKAFVNNASANTLTEKKIEISHIFDWYSVDFQGGVIPFLNKYANLKIKDNAKISFKEYDWRLNE